MKLSKKRAREIAEGLLEYLQEDIGEILMDEEDVDEDGCPTDRAFEAVELEIIKYLQRKHK